MRNYMHYVITMALAIALIISINSCHYNRLKDHENMIAITDSLSHFKNKLGTKTAEIKTLQLDKQQLKHLILNKDKELSLLTKDFSKVNSIIKYKTLVQFDTIRITYKDTIPCIFRRFGEVKENWYNFSYDSNQKGIVIDSFKTHTETTIINGFKRKWFLGKQTLTTNISNSNPYLEVTQIKSVEIKVPQPWYKKWYVWLALGISTGLLSSQ